MTHDVIFLIDVDNTLLDNDRITDDLRTHLTGNFGKPDVTVEKIVYLLGMDAATMPATHSCFPNRQLGHPDAGRSLVLPRMDDLGALQPGLVQLIPCCSAGSASGSGPCRRHAQSSSG